MMTPEQLKNSILQRAIEGKLVPCDLSKWKQVKLGDVIKKDLGGGTPDKTHVEYWNGKIPWMSVKDFNNTVDSIVRDTVDHISELGLKNSSSNLVDTDGIVLCTRMGLGKYAKLSIPTAINQDLRAIWLKNVVDECFFLYWYSILKINGTGVTVKGIKKRELFNIDLSLPPLAEQKRIVAKLEELLPLVDEYAEAYHKLQTINSKFPADLKKSLLQYAMEGKLVPCDLSKWKQVKLGDVFTIVSSRRVMQSDWKMNGVPFYRAREIAILAEHGKVDNELFISEELFKKLSQNGVPKDGDLMVSAVGTLGKTYIVQKNDRFYYKDASVICLENRLSLNSQFYKYVMLSELMRKQILSNSGGTTVGTLTISRMNEYVVPLPPIEDQKRIVTKLEELLPLCEEIG